MRFTWKTGKCVAAVVGLLMTAACADDEPDQTKGQIDVNTLQLGTTVTLTADIGSASVPLIVALPDENLDEIATVLSAVVSLVVTNDATAVSADLSSGSPVDVTPAAAGQYSWSVNSTRDLATLTFYNMTANGLSLQVGGKYNAMLSVAENAFVETVGTVSIPVTVSGG